MPYGNDYPIKSPGELAADGYALPRRNYAPLPRTCVRINAVATLLIDYGTYLNKTYLYAKENIRPTITEALSAGAHQVMVAYDGSYFLANKDGIVNAPLDTPLVMRYLSGI
jgi:hypothetical protein